MSIATIIKKSTLACALLYAITATLPAWADICFLPTGECEQAAKNKAASYKDCSEYIDGLRYFSSNQENMNCSVASIEGCSLYECMARTCSENGFNLGPTDSAGILPDGYSNADWDCESCKQGSQYRWKCSPRPCDAPFKTIAECGGGEVWQQAASSATHKSGSEYCGICEEPHCGAGQVDAIPSGCVTCVLEETSSGLRSCYKCKDMVGYMKEGEYFSNYDSSCYENRSKQSADGDICYKPVEKSCPSTQYRSEEYVNGKKLCRCSEYGYILDADKKSLQFTAAGGESVITITSQRVGNEREDWDYSAPSVAGVCSIAKSDNYLTVKCGKNASLKDLEYDLVLTQTGESGSDVNSLTISIVIDADKCSVGQLSTYCTDSGCEAQANGTLSDAGQTCYDCVECRSGVRAAVRGAVAKGFNAIKNLFN